MDESIRVLDFFVHVFNPLPSPNPICSMQESVALGNVSSQWQAQANAAV